ncbi:GNAT family N-acetyltransferase [Thiocystis minor]|uniref:GNAT family N-acetyltransferase n=1 Tax=Thiocystis minor TaxID=61597 RepID=UPI0019127C03|nr:GNAT family N-acetyltransferase [Thiocystis minor]MBK5965556.1 GNAT family N-acetyltransferase [Thiocystis minor]
MSALVIEPLGLHHDRTAFACGHEALDLYLRQQAGQDSRRRLARVFVCIEPDRPAILGFYTLSAVSIDLSVLPPHLVRRLPRQPVPAVLIGRLAVALGMQGQGLGRLLLADAVKRTLSVSATIGIHAMVVDAKDHRSKQFYERYGFLALPDSVERLFLPLGSLV